MQFDDYLWYSGRVSELWCRPIINLFNRRLTTVQLIALWAHSIRGLLYITGFAIKCYINLVEPCYQRSTHRRKIFHVQSLGQSSRGKNHYFWRYPKFLSDILYDRWKEAPRPKTCLAWCIVGLESIDNNVKQSSNFFNIISQQLSFKHFAANGRLRLRQHAQNATFHIRITHFTTALAQCNVW